MAKLIHNTLSRNETITQEVGMHKFFFFRPVAELLAGIALAALVLYFGAPWWVAVWVVVPFWLIFLWRVLVYNSTEQVLTSKRVFYKEGVFVRDTDEIRNEAIETISVRQSIMGRLLGYGSIDFSGSGGTRLGFSYVPKPIKVKHTFENQLDSAENEAGQND